MAFPRNMLESNPPTFSKEFLRINTAAQLTQGVSNVTAQKRLFSNYSPLCIFIEPPSIAVVGFASSPSPIWLS